MTDLMDYTAEEERTMQARLAFHSALLAVQDVAKTEIADTGRYTYAFAPLSAVLDECKRVCQMFGLAITQSLSAVDDHFAVFTTLIHEHGGQVEFPALRMRMPNDPQALGSAATYARRYALLTIFAIAPDDDDAKEATRAVRAPQEPQYGGFRTGAEQRIRQLIDGLPEKDATAIKGLFREQFAMGLADLPPSKHGDALTWLNETLAAAKAEGPPEGGKETT